MDMCDALENWGHLTPDNKLEAIQDLLAHMANDYDVPVPEVKSGVPDFPSTPEDDSQKAAAYDADTNTMYINEEIFRNQTPDEALAEAGHEFAHELYAEQVDDEDYDSKESEDYADAYDDQMRDELEDYCNNPPPPQSPGTPDDDTGDWNLPAGDSAYA